ncbi:MAG: tRNA guanosine(34) transglycosylase Tgt [Defluviitaleaceae bacterium]|nr:tRNA guanosine(34) transglycosylase Tgt [Defluviitaleaceae bacterium]
MYTIKAINGQAKRAALETPHGTIETPVFMNVATAAAIKGALSASDLRAVGCEVALCNTYHLHLRPSEGVVRDMGGLQKFMAWDRPVLTDSGGFQVFSLGALRKIKEEGVYFNSHIDGRKIFMGPEESMEIQHALGATIAMAFDECAPFPASREYIRDSVARTTRWLTRSKTRTKELNAQEGREQLIFGINQGGIYDDIRIEHAKEISEMDLDGYALGGLAVGEPAEEMYKILEATVPHLPQNKPIYLMGVGTPENLLEAIERGIDFFDCVLPARNGRHGQVYTSRGKLNMNNATHERDERPLDPDCHCEVCRTHTRAYIRHLFKAKEMLAMRLAVMHNLYFYNNLMRETREAIETGNFSTFKKNQLEKWKSGGLA